VFTEDGSDYCEESDIIYTMTTNIAPADTTFITFDETSMTVTWSTAAIANIGVYIITITGAITRNDGSLSSATTSFSLDIL
jgi:hypothetical protein